MDDVGRRPLKVSLVLPFEEWMGGDTARWSDLVAMTPAAEALGFDSLWLVGHFWYRFRSTTTPSRSAGGGAACRPRRRDYAGSKGTLYCAFLIPRCSPRMAAGGRAGPAG